MLILGEQHRFSKLELEVLAKKFKNINFIKYKGVNTDELISQVSLLLKKKNKTLLLLNTKAPIPNEFISYLTQVEFEGLEYISLESFMEKYLDKCYIPNELTNLNFLEKAKPFNRFDRFFKFIIDYSFSISILILSLPIMLFSIYKIKKESPGPIFFKQKRMGRKGKEFICIKFRSMGIDAEKNGAKFATEDDDRVFPWGKIMRSTRIDEIPQLWNVLRGEMHLIGPRPERKIWIKEFEKEIPYYNERHIIRPGLTGWAQVLYPYGTNAYDAKQKLAYDLYYIKHWSPWLEFKTVWKTILVVFSREGV